MRSFLLPLALILFVASGALAQDKTFDAQTFMLENGLQVVVIPNNRAPVVTHMIWYRVGAADEAPGLSGMAHYLEHLLFKGTPTMPPGDFSKTIRVLGGNDNAFTGQDFTAFFESISADHLERVMKMEADRMLNINPPREHFDSEKQVVLEERRQRTENDPQGLLSEQMESALYVNHPYANPIIGWMSEIESYDWKDVKSFYDTRYAPNNAILIVSGDITVESFKPLAVKIFGPLERKDVPARKRPEIPPAPAPVRITLHHAAIQQPMLYKTRLAPAESKHKAESLALQVLEDILDGGPTTRLYKALVVEQKKAASVNLSYRASALDYGSIGISATPAPDVSLDEIERLIDEQLRKIAAEGVTEQEVKEAIQRLQDQAIFSRDSLSGPAMIMGYALTTGSTVEDVENWPRDIGTVTPAQVQEAAKTYLNPDSPWIRPPVTGYLLPKETQPEPAKESAL